MAIIKRIAIQAGHYNKGGGALSKEYIAGYIDGEGWFRIQKQNKNKNPNYHLIIGCSGTENTVLELIKKQYGGSVHKREKRYGWKPEYTYLTSCRQAEKLLNDIYPFLVLKKDRAEVCFELYKRIPLGKKTVLNYEELSIREFLYLKIKKLNLRGTKNA